MPYTTPVTDRDQDDIDAQNSKAYFNVADWERIHDNAQHVNGLFSSALGVSLSFIVLDDPIAATYFHSVGQFNLLFENIERMRAWARNYLADYLSTSLANALKTDWQAGAGVPVPNFENINEYESVIDVMYVTLNAWSAPSLSGNLDLGGGGSLELGGGGFLELGA